MDRLNINIDGLTFDRANYDAEGDVLYLSRGEERSASDATLTREGHGIRYGVDSRVIGVTIIKARFISAGGAHHDHVAPRGPGRRTGVGGRPRLTGSSGHSGVVVCGALKQVTVLGEHA